MNLWRVNISLQFASVFPSTFTFLEYTQSMGQAVSKPRLVIRWNLSYS